MAVKTIFRIGSSRTTAETTFTNTRTPSGERVISVKPETHRRALAAATAASVRAPKPPLQK